MLNLVQVSIQVFPAEAGIFLMLGKIPAYAGMTKVGYLPGTPVSTTYSPCLPVLMGTVI